MEEMNKKDDDNLGSFYMGRQRSPSPRRRLPPGALTVLVLLAFAGIVWYAYPRGAEKYTDMDVPVVKADTSPLKVAPKDPGGMEVPHQDSTVFDPLAKKDPNAVEKLLPSPEEPVDKAQAIKETEAPKPPVVAVLPVPEVKLDLQTKEASIAPEKETEKAESKPALAVVEGKTYIQLGSFRDRAGAQKGWDRLKKKYPALLGKLTMKTAKVDLPGKGIYYRLQAGKLSEAHAREVCKAVKGCILVK